MTENAPTVLLTCQHCCGPNIETCLPAFFKTNDELQFVSVDFEAEALSYYCHDCQDSVTVVHPGGRTECGRWGD